MCFVEGLQNQINESLYTIVGLLISLATIYVVIYLNKLISKAKIEAKKIAKINETKWLFEKINTNDKPLAMLIKEK